MAAPRRRRSGGARALVALGAAAAAAACGRASAPDAARAAALFERVTIATEPGLSGLAVDAAGALWTVPERARRAYRITLGASAGAAPALEVLRIDGVPDGTDLEAIAVLGEGRFALGTEGRRDGAAAVLLAERRGDALAVTGAIALTEAQLGTPVRANHGTEGVCGAGAVIVAAIETAIASGDRRWAPVVRIVDGRVAATYRVGLTSARGKLSGLDCSVGPAGDIAVLAIERHFETTHLVRFTLPPLVPAGSAGPIAIAAEVALDLSPVLRGALNLEGIAELPGGRIVAVVDNQWKRISGPSELLVFRARAPGPPPAAGPSR
jgi:hypothetical protein